MQSELTRPIVGIENRTAQEVFDIMCDRFKIALSTDAEPVAQEDYKALFEECQLARDEVGFFGSVPDCIRYLAAEANTAAPPAPSVAVKAALEEAATAVDKDWREKSGLNCTEVCAIIRSIGRSALSGQVQDVAGWQSMDSAPKDGSEFVAGRRYTSEGEFVVHTYKWEGPPNYWHAKRNGVCIRPEYQKDFLWFGLPAAPAAKQGEEE